MKTTTLGLGILIVLLGGWLALPDSARADDDDEREIAGLTTENQRLKAEINHLHEAYCTATANLTRAVGAVSKLKNTMQELRERIAGFELARGGEERQVKKLEDDIQGWHRFYQRLLVSVGKPAVKPLLGLLQEDPVHGMPWICPIFGKIGRDATEAVPYLRRIAANKRHQQRGVARYAEEALAKIAPSKASAAMTQLSNIGNAIVNYRLTNKKLPSWLEELTETSGRNPTPFIESIPNDPWGNPYEYRVLDRRTYQIRSNGMDGMPDTEDDIVWPIKGK